MSAGPENSEPELWRNSHWLPDVFRPGSLEANQQQIELAVLEISGGNRELARLAVRGFSREPQAQHLAAQMERLYAWALTMHGGGQ